MENLRLENFSRTHFGKGAMMSFIKNKPNRDFENFFKIQFVSNFFSLSCLCFGYFPEEPAVAEGKVLHIFSFLFSKKLKAGCESHWKRFCFHWWGQNKQESQMILSRTVPRTDKLSWLAQSLLKSSLRSHESFFTILMVLLLFGVFKFWKLVNLGEGNIKHLWDLGELFFFFFFFPLSFFWFQIL